MEFDDKDVERFWSHVIKGPACWHWRKHRTASGHGQLKVKGKRVYAHRFSYRITYGPITPGAVIRHKCNKPSCVRPDHLETGSQADNVADRVKAGRSATGERNGRSKLSSFQVARIKRALKLENSNIYQLAKKYRVTRKVIRDIREGRTWKHVEVY